MSAAFLTKMGNRIAQRRKELHLTQEKLSERIGLSSQEISSIELGKKAARPENLAKICSALDVSADYILYGKISEPQINDFYMKVSQLSQEEYKGLMVIVELLHNRK